MGGSFFKEEVQKIWRTRFGLRRAQSSRGWVVLCGAEIPAGMVSSFGPPTRAPRPALRANIWCRDAAHPRSADTTDRAADFEAAGSTQPDDTPDRAPTSSAPGSPGDATHPSHRAAGRSNEC